MARVFITGASDGLGLMAGQLLLEQGHSVVLHARNEKRATELRSKVGGAEAIVIGDLSSIAQTKSVAEQVNELGVMDAVIHNAAVGYQERKRLETEDGLPHVFAVNTLAPYILTALIRKPKRLVYLSSGLHQQGDASLNDLLWQSRRWDGTQAYSDTKLHDVLLAFAVARRWPDVLSNALEPGWVATKMGGPRAPDDLDQGHRTGVAGGERRSCRESYRPILLPYEAACDASESPRCERPGETAGGLQSDLGAGTGSWERHRLRLRTAEAKRDRVTPKPDVLGTRIDRATDALGPPTRGTARPDGLA